MHEQSTATIEYLMNELDHTRTRIGDLLKSGDQLLAIVGTLIAGLFFAVSAIDKIDLRLAAPFALLVPAAFVLRLNALIQHFGGYRKCLEERLNELLGKEVFCWESTIAPLLKKSYASLLSTITLGLVWAGSCAYALDALGQSHLGVAVKICLAGGYPLSGIALAAAQISGQRLFGRAYKACCKRISVATAETSHRRGTDA
jgi:hypothetical protein